MKKLFITKLIINNTFLLFFHTIFFFSPYLYSENLAELSKSGLDLILKGKYEEAAKILATIEKNPKDSKNAEYLRLKTKYLLETGGYNKLIKLLKKVETTNQELSLNLVSAQIATGDYRQAAIILKRIIDANPSGWKARILDIHLTKLSGNKRQAAIQRRYFTNLYKSGKLSTALSLTAAALALENKFPKTSLECYKKAQENDNNYLNSYIYAGLLCHRKYAWERAKREFKSALKINPNDPMALTGTASVLIANGNDFSLALSLLNKALKVNPNFTPALTLKAEIFLIEKDLSGAKENLKKTLLINPRNQDALALLAAYYDVNGEKEECDKKIVLFNESSKNNAGIYNILSGTAERLYRFKKAVKWARKAIACDPDNWQGYYNAGMNLLRLGEEKEGYGLLNKSFRRNPYNIFAYNILIVMDRDFKNHEFDLHTTDHFAVKISKYDSEIIWPYLKPLLEKTYKRFTTKYKVIPKGSEEYNGKILLLICNDDQSFSARVMGLPSIGAIGVCFGQVIMLPSPKFACIGGGKGMNWKSVFEHEFMHVLSLQKSNYLVSRWFTEGLSSWEESDKHTNWSRIFAVAGKQHKLLKVEGLESVFLQQEFPGQIAVNYYQSSLICRYINKKYGFDAILKMLDLYFQKHKTKDILTNITGLQLKEVNRDLAAYYKKDWEAKNEVTAEIRKIFEEKSKENEVKQKQGKRKWEKFVETWEKNDEINKAIVFLEKLIKHDDRDYLPFKILGRLYLKNEQFKKSTDILLSAIYRNPYDIDVHNCAYKAYLQLGYKDAANREKRVIDAIKNQ